LESILHCTPSGNSKPFVCLVCDGFLLPNEVRTLSVEKLEEAKEILTLQLRMLYQGQLEEITCAWVT